MPELLPFRRELYRKYFHLTSSLFGLSILYFGKETMMPFMVVGGVIIPILDYGRQRFHFMQKLFFYLFDLFIRPNEKKDITGATYVFISAAIVVVFFDKIPAATGLLFMSIGDSFAAIFGQKYGYTKIGDKSLEGTLAFIISCVIVAMFIPGLNLYTGIVAIIISSYVELFSGKKLSDNLLIPIVAAMIIQFVGGSR